MYGPGEALGAGKWRGTPATVWRNVVPTFVYKAIRKEGLPVEGEGDATRDFIYIEDIVAGLLTCAVQGAPGEVYNLASGAETSIRELAVLINELTENPTPVEWQPRRTWDHSGKRFGSTEKSRRELGFSAGMGIREGLARTIAWTQDNLPLIKTCIQKHAAYYQC